MLDWIRVLRPTPTHTQVDGNRVPPALQAKGEAIVKGDSKSYIIGAASIIAKVGPLRTGSPSVQCDRMTRTSDERLAL